MAAMRPRDDQSLNFYLLRCLVALVEHSHVTRAADALDMSQPAMSRAMSQLRRLTGDPILVKGQSGLVPTVKAIRLRDFAVRLLQGVDHLLGDALSFDPTQTPRTFRVVATDYIECVFLDPMVMRLSAAYPSISVAVSHPLDPKLLNGHLERGEADFCLGMLPSSLDALKHQLLFRDRICCLAARSHPAAGRRLSAAEFAQLEHVVIRPTVRAFAEVVDEALARQGLERNVRLVTPSYLTVPYALESTRLVALVPATAANRFADRFALTTLDVDIELPAYEVYLYWHERTHHHEDHVWFRAQVLDEMQRIVADEAQRFFRGAVREHHRQEEREFFPAVLSGACDAAEREQVRAMVQRLAQEHREVEAAFARLEPALQAIARGERPSVSSEELAAQVRGLVHRFEGHARHEEREFLPLAARILGHQGAAEEAPGSSAHIHLWHALPEVLLRFGSRF
jgi:DNA-binding transcriptional LysR family regulator